MSGPNPPAVFSRGKSFRSGLWATFQQFAIMGSAAVSGIILARSLSVAEFGVFSYATTLASIGTVIVTAGLSGLAVKLLVNGDTDRRRTMTALIVTREIFAVVAFLLLFGVSWTSGESETIALTALALVVLFARAFDASEYWFQARAESRKTAPIKVSVVLAMLLVRFALALMGAPLIVFVVLYVLEALVISALMLVRYFRDADSDGLGRPELRTPTRLIASSWVLLASGIAAQLNTRGDIVLIQALLGSEDVGIYAAAARLSELFYFLPVVFMTATFPRLLQIRDRHGIGSGEYRRELQASYDRACWAGVAVGAAVFLLGPTLLRLLYGSDYAAAGPILQVHVIALPFVFMAAVFSKWIIAEGLYWASLLRHLAGAAINVGLNFALIPSIGILGAAYASLVSYVVASYVSCFFGRRTRPAAIQMTLAILWPFRLGIDAASSIYKKVTRT